MSLVYDREWYAKAKIFQISHFLRERYDFGQKVDLELEHVAASEARAYALDGEYTSGNADISLLYFSRPIVKYLLGRQFQTKTIPVGLEFLSLDVIFPALACVVKKQKQKQKNCLSFRSSLNGQGNEVKENGRTEDVLDALEVHGQLIVNLLDPYDGTRDGRYVSDHAHLAAFALGILDLEFFMKRLNVVLDALYQLSLIFPDGASYMGPDKESVEA